MELSLAPRGLRCTPLGWDDAPALQALLVTCARYFALAEKRALDKLEGQERVAEALGDGDQLLLGVALPSPGGPLLGLVDLRAHVPEPGTATLSLLLIDPAHRRRGHAAALVTELARALTEAGFQSLHLGVQDGAPEARSFWEAQGFEETGRDSGVTHYVRLLT